MKSAVFIGDELTAAAFRLAGADARVVAPEETPATLRSVLEGDAALVVLAAAHAAQVGAIWLHSLIKACDPPIAVVGDLAGRCPAPDLDAEVRSRLGIAQ